MTSKEMKTFRNISVFEAQKLGHLLPGKMQYTSAYSFTITNNGTVIAIFDEKNNTLKIEKNFYNANLCQKKIITLKK